MEQLALDNLLVLATIGFFSSIATCLLIILSKKWHLAYSSDTLSGPQKIHIEQVPRIGGLAILASLIAAAIANIPFALQIILGSLPVFLAGISEDITKQISPNKRLIASLLSAFLLIWLLSLQLSADGIPVLNQLFDIYIIALIITLLSITVMSQAVNIIDGLNGLSIGTTLIITATIGLLAYGQNDILLMKIN